MSEGWREVRRVGSDQEAGMVAAFLRTNDITVEVDSRIFHQEPVALGQLGMARVMVPEHEAAEAIRLLDALDAESSGEEHEEPSPGS